MDVAKLQITANAEPVDETIERVRIYTMGAVNPARYAHSVRTAQTAQKLCSLFGIDEKRGYLAGIGHDMCKDMPDQLLLSLVTHDGRPVSELEQKKPSLLHGRCAAVKMREDFGIVDTDILEAVAYHTFGGASIGPLAKIIYVADKVEPGREHVTEAYLKHLFAFSLDEIVYSVLSENLDYLKKKGKAVAPETLVFYEALKKQLKNK